MDQQPNQNPSDYEKELERLSRLIIEEVENSEGMTLQDAMGIENRSLDEIYHLAYENYNQGKYKEAESLFYLIMCAAPNNFDYVFGFAATLYQQKNFEQAAVGFYLAMHLQPSPMTSYYLTNCFVYGGMKEEALDAAELTISLCDEFEGHEEIKERCLLIKKNMEKN